MRRSFFMLCLLLGLCAGTTHAQDAALSGLVTDSSGGAVPKASVQVQNQNTGIKLQTQTNGQGIYSFPFLKPGPYEITVQANGFKTVNQTGITLAVAQTARIDFSLQVGTVTESVTVGGGAPLVNTTDGSVSAVVDRRFVENMPLNGRSFQDLILLTPGVVTNSPQQPGFLGVNGEFSVNGQRTESNYYSVDGVSGNVGTATTIASPGLSGSLPAATSLGTTQALVSVDALEEFRVQTSSYSAEYGRNPGGQFSFVTRSGTNQWHGSLFDYLRNDLFDASDRFNNRFGKPKPALRQNDFGGTLGGPVRIPHLYNGQDKSFFFFSYEGLRLLQPQAASVSNVPSLALRQSAPSVLQPVLNAFPLPNGQNLGNGLAQFIGTWSNPSNVDSLSIRGDHSFNEKLRVFFRFQNTSSNTDVRAIADPSNKQSTSDTSRSYTFGLSSTISSGLTNEVRINYSSNVVHSTIAPPDSFGGATPTDLLQLQGISSGNAAFSTQFTLPFAGVSPAPALLQVSQAAKQRQWNVTDVVGIALGRHLLKFGADYRRMSPTANEEKPASISQPFATRNNSLASELGGAEILAFLIREILSDLARAGRNGSLRPPF